MHVRAHTKSQNHTITYTYSMCNLFDINHIYIHIYIGIYDKKTTISYTPKYVCDVFRKYVCGMRIIRTSQHHTTPTIPLPGVQGKSGYPEVRPRRTSLATQNINAPDKITQPPHTHHQVLCKAMGYPDGGSEVDFAFGGGRNPPPRIWMWGVKCAGGEGDIADCSHRPWGSLDTPVGRCGHDSDVGLCCRGLLRLSCP